MRTVDTGWKWFDTELGNRRAMEVAAVGAATLRSLDMRRISGIKVTVQRLDKEFSGRLWLIEAKTAKIATAWSEGKIAFCWVGHNLSNGGDDLGSTTLNHCTNKRLRNLRRSMIGTCIALHCDGNNESKSCNELHSRLRRLIDVICLADEVEK